MTTGDVMAKSARKSAKQESLAAIPGALVLVGAGKMGGAMLDGWLARKLPPKKLIVLEPQPSLGLAQRTSRPRPFARQVAPCL